VRLTAAIGEHAGRARHALLLGWTPSGRLAVTLGVLCCLGLLTFSQGPIAASLHRRDDSSAGLEALSTMDHTQAASRSAARGSSKLTGAAPSRAGKKAPTMPKPVAGLTQTQMNNAYQIVQAGQALHLPKQAYVIAIATAMQESRLYNLASGVVPESLRYPHQGTGSDHDSVGLFQQRASSGWGAVRDLMKPRYSATKFYLALRQVPDWRGMALTYAAQAVQVSAYPEAYAQHEWVARKVVDALT
jgi:hypothetical protein